MIQKTITYECRFCHSTHIVKNGIMLKAINNIGAKIAVNGRFWN